jgi:hypothetical protein
MLESMSDSSPANIELAIVLPLGVAANQLLKLEADLRFLNMKALAYAKDRENVGVDRRISAHLDTINEALELIRCLVADIAADIRPAPANSPRSLSGREGSRKPSPDQDD